MQCDVPIVTALTDRQICVSLLTRIFRTVYDIKVRLIMNLLVLLWKKTNHVNICD